LGSEYNIVKDPTVPPMSGRTHSKESKTIMSDAKQGITGSNHPRFGKNHTKESKTIMSEAKKGKPRPEGAGKPSQQIEVTDITNNTIISYDSINKAAIALNLPNHNIISHYIQRNQKKPYKGRYTFKKI